MVWDDGLSVRELTEMRKKTPQFPSRERNFAMRRRGIRRGFSLSLGSASPIAAPPPNTREEEGADCNQRDSCNNNVCRQKNCTSCKCPREAHDVCHEEWVSVRSRLGLKGDESSSPSVFDPRAKGLAWAPPGLPAHKVDEYFSMLPEISVPRLGTPGERYRDRQLAFQLPKQDLARAYCRHLNPKHASSADDFMAARNEIALDIGSVQEVLERDVDCGACHTPIKYGSLAVLASKLGLLYHPTCFRCSECKELLVDLAYCVHDDTLFCERHYAEQLKPRCAACDEKVIALPNFYPGRILWESLIVSFEMGLMLSILIGCVGVLELLACLRHVTDGVVIRINQPATPCLSYHEPTSDNRSTHDSICSFSHSSDVNLPRGAKHKLENLHEYSLRIRTELRSLDKNYDGNTLSEWSTREFLNQSRPSPDSRLSPDFNYLVEASESQEDHEVDVEENRKCERETSYEDAGENWRLESSSRDRPLSVITPEPDKYVRIPTPIPFDVNDELSSSGASSDVGTSFDNDSGNEAPTMRSIETIPVIKRYKSPSEGGSSIDESDASMKKRFPRRLYRRSRSKSPESIKNSENTEEIDTLNRSENLDAIQGETTKVTSQRKRIKSSSTIVRKPTRLKSKNTEVSKSAENLTARRSKRHREPERRKSDISMERKELRDESTNTSPLGSPVLSRSESRKSVSVQVQTSFDEELTDAMILAELEGSVVGLSESRRDRVARRSFKNRRFVSSCRDKAAAAAADDDDDDGNHSPDVFSVTNATASVEAAPTKDASRLLKISSFEEADDEDYQRLRAILADSDSKETNGKRWKDSKSLSSFDDEDYWDAEDVSAGTGPIQYSIPDPDPNQAFWLIFSGEYTKAMNKDWHSGHFCCWQCDESLTGQRYVLRDEHPYCIKCYENVFANGCEECNKIIGIDSKDLSYKDKHWHEACFLCNRCRVSLVDKQFGSKVDKIYCGNCYDAQFASRCDGCGEIFRAGTKKMEYKTRQWHEKCFCCVVCKNPIGTKSFIPREQEIYCAGCYEDKFATRCVKCNKIITSGGVTYKNEPWHRDCFTCSNCNNSLAGQRFTSRDDKPYCADCFGELFAKRCTACSKPITGIGGTRFISFEDRHWHNDCFICAGCKTSLVGHGFITDGEDIICPDCAKMKLM